MCPLFAFSLASTFFMLFQEKHRAWELVVLPPPFPRDWMVCVVNFATRGAYFWLDHFQTPPTFLHDLIRLNLVSPEFSHFIFIPWQSLGTFHPSFSTDCMQLQTDSRLNVLWPFYHHPGEPTSLCKLNTQSGNHCDCAVISHLALSVCHGNQCQKYHHQIWKLWETKESSSSAKLLLLIMPNRYNQPSLEDIQQHTVTASTKPMYDSPVTAQTFETLQSNQHDQTT